uniref:Protein-tyrosine phosphatase containing protein n=1 Tax=Wuchereria bancrofti TaxID=6293 RepID=A0AAF5RU34_WUCBA
MDYRKMMMEKFQKMRLRQKEIRNAAVNKKEPAPDKTKSKREGRKTKASDEKSSRAEKNDFFNTFSLRSRRERKRKKKEKLNESKSKREKKKNAEEKSMRARKKKLRDFPVTDEQKENYSNFLLEMFGLGVDGIVKQYQADLKTYIPPDMSHTAFDKNMKKNRYKDVICIDKTRVILQEGESDYIHANHVKGDPFLNSFICTQGPMKITVNDFWIMIMQEKVSNIVMLCNILEAGKNKCFQYWPQDVGSSLTFGDIQVSCSEVNDNKDTTFIISILQAENKNIRLTIKHIRWKEWCTNKCIGPISDIVHCSAGIGRTGCIVAIEMGLQQILSGKPLFLIDMVKKLRSMRMSAIQTDEQLVYVVRCLVAYADACGLFNSKPELQEKAEKFSDEYTTMLAAKKAARKQKITAQPETERTDDQAAIMKVEEKKEEPSQKSKQSVQEVIERATVLRLEPPKIEQKQLQPLQIFANEKQSSKVEQAPSAVPVQQIEKLTQPIPAPLVAKVQGQLKQVQLIPTTPAVPIQQPQKQVQPVPLAPVVPIQQSEKQTQPVPTTPAVPIQQSQKQIQQIPTTPAVPIQQPQKQVQPVPPAPVVPIQQSQKQTQSVPTTPAVPTHQSQKQIQPVLKSPVVAIQQSQKQTQPVSTAPAVPTQQSQKQIQPVSTTPAVPIPQPQKQIQPVQTAPTPTVPTPQLQKQIQSAPRALVPPIEQSQKQIQPVPTTPAVPIQQPQKQVQSTPKAFDVPTQQPQKQIPVIAKSKSTQNAALKPTQMPSSSTTPSKTSNYEPSNTKK